MASAAPCELVTRLRVWLLGVTLVACAGSGERATTVETLPEGLPKATGTCLHTATISSWRALDSRRILIDTGRRDWIVEFYRSCFGLRTAEQLAFSSNDSRLCDYRNDAFLVRGEHCSIASIRPYVEEFDETLQEELDQLEEEGTGSEPQ